MRLAGGEVVPLRSWLRGGDKARFTLESVTALRVLLRGVCGTGAWETVWQMTKT